MVCWVSSVIHVNKATYIMYLVVMLVYYTGQAGFQLLLAGWSAGLPT